MIEVNICLENFIVYKLLVQDKILNVTIKKTEKQMLMQHSNTDAMNYKYIILKTFSMCSLKIYGNAGKSANV